MLEVLDAVDRVAGTSIKRELAPRRPGDPDELVSDPALLFAKLGWQPRFAELDTIVAHALAWERQLAQRGLAPGA